MSNLLFSTDLIVTEFGKRKKNKLPFIKKGRCLQGFRKGKEIEKKKLLIRGCIWEDRIFELTEIKKKL